MSVKSISSFSCFATSFSFSLLSTRSSQVSLPKVLFGGKQNVVHHWRPVHPSILKPKRKLQKRRKMISLVAAEDVFFPDEEIGIDVSDPEDYSLDAEVVSLDNIQNEPYDENGGKPGFVSFYSLNKRESSDDTSRERENQNSLIWFAGPTILVASFILPSLYLRRIISTIFEDSLLTDFLILFFTEALFYCGVALFLLLIHFIQKPSSPLSSSYSDRNSTSLAGHRVSSVAILMLSLIIPMVTMGFVWPWTGPAASAALAPYLVGIVVQFAFEQYARYVKSPSWPVIPVVFQVYRLHQLNRAAQLVTALTFTVRGAEMTAHNLAINNSLGTLLNVLQLLGLICIWSLSSFLIRFSLLLTQRTR